MDPTNVKVLGARRLLINIVWPLMWLRGLMSGSSHIFSTAYNDADDYLDLFGRTGAPAEKVSHHLLYRASGIAEEH
jgi:hypothetical protein